MSTIELNRENPTPAPPSAKLLRWVAAVPGGNTNDGNRLAWGIDTLGGNVELINPYQPWSLHPEYTVEWVAVASDGTVCAAGDGQLARYTDAGWQLLPALPGGAGAKQITTGSAQAIACLDSKNNVYLLSSDSSAWTPVGSSFKTVDATSDGAIIGLNFQGAPEQYQPDKGMWVPLTNPGEVLTALAAGVAGFIFGIAQSGKILQYDGDQSWQPLPNPDAPLVFLAAGDDDSLWGLDENGSPYQFDPQAQQWDAVTAPPNPLQMIAIGSAANIWAVAGDPASSQSQLYQYTEKSVAWLETGGSDDDLVKLWAADEENLWGVTREGVVWHLQMGEGRWDWSRLPDAMSWLGVATDGTVWGVTPDGEPRCWNQDQNNWESIPSPAPMTQIVVGSADAVFALDQAGNVYQYDGSQQTWAVIPGMLLKQVCAGADGSLMGINQSDLLCLYMPDASAWYTTTNKLQQISVGDGSNIWGIDLQGQAIDLTADGPLFDEATTAIRRNTSSFRTLSTLSAMWDTESVFDEAQSTHLWIVNRAAQALGPLGGIGRIVHDLVGPWQGQTPSPSFHNKLCQGLYDADFKEDYNGPSRFGQATYVSHFYDPDTGKNWQGQTDFTAKTQGVKFYNQAVTTYTTNQVEAGYWLGLSLHYLTDLTQPMHSANYTWLSSKPIPGYHSAFETYVMEQQARQNMRMTYSDPNPTMTGPGGFFDAAARNSKTKYFPKLASDDWYFGWTDGWARNTDPLIWGMLYDAILITAQYLMYWGRAALPPQAVDRDDR